KILHINKSLGYYREMVGVSSTGKRVNPLIVDGYSRVFNGFLSGGLGNISILNAELKKLYAKSLLNFSYQSIYMGRLADARGYCISSLNVSFFSYKQLVIYSISYLGPLAVLLAKLRAHLVRVSKSIF